MVTAERSKLERIIVMEITYLKISIGSIPFKEIPTLESFSHQYVWCSAFSLHDFMGLNHDLLSVYNAYDDQVDSLNELNDDNLLFGKVVSDKLPTRGKTKCIKVGYSEKIIRDTDLPHLKYYSGTAERTGSWFFMKNGNYFILAGIKSEYEKVKHLEGINIYGENIIRLRLVIELLKKNVKARLLVLSEEDYKMIAYKVLRTDPTLLKSDEDIIVDGVNNWTLSMVLTPLYKDILPQHRGRVLE